MKRSLLVYLYFALLGQLAFGQVQMFADTVNSGCTSSVDVPIRVSNYVDMLSMQGTVHWDVANLSYNSIVDYGPASIGLTNGNFGFGSTGSGNLMFSWNDPNLSGETLADSTIIFTLRFDVVGAGSFITPISFENSPTQLEFVDLTYTPIAYTTNNGAVDIACSSCAINSITAGTQTSCDFANNFYTQELTLVYSAPPGSGSISVNGQLFPITGSPQVVVLDSLISDGNAVNVNAFFTADPACTHTANALFTAPSDCVSGALDIFADHVSSGCTSTIDVPIRVSDFDDMLSMQGTVHWDIAYLNYNSIVDYGPVNIGLNNGNFGFGSTASGNLMFSWNDADLTGETLADSTTIFTIRFDVIGAGSFNTPIGFQNTPTLLEFVDLTYAPIPYVPVNGSVDITCATCGINNVTATVQSVCDPANNFYTQELTLTYTAPPATGSISANGQLFPITGSPQVIVLDSLVSDGNPVDVTVFFTDDVACTSTINALFTAPTSCFTNDVDIFADVINEGCVSTVDVPVRVSDFVNMLSMQGTVHWDIANLGFNSIVDYGPVALNMNSGNFGTSNTATGDLTFSWNDADLSSETLTDSTIIFTIRFDVLTSGIYSTPITFTNAPTSLEFVNQSLTPIAYTTSNGEVNISCSTCVLINIVAGNQTNCDPANNYYTQELTLTYSVPPVAGSISVNGQFFPITGSPQVIVLDSLVADGNPVDVTAYFTDDVGCNYTQSGLFTSPVSCLTNDADIFADNVTAACETTVDVPVRVSDFVDMLSFQGTLHWDPLLLSFNSIVDYGPAALALNSGNFGTTNTASGDLTYSWNDADLTGETLSDSTIVFTVRLNVISNGVFTTPISFENSPTMLEFVNLALSPIPYSTYSGSVAINCPAPNTIDLYYSEYTCSDDSVYTIDVTANNFDNIVSYQGTVEWDTTYFAFDSISYFGPANVLLTNANFGLPLTSDGALTFSWYDTDLSGEDLADSTILFSFILNTTANNFDCSTISFDNTPTPIEFIDSSSIEVPTSLNDVTICKSFVYYDTLQICAGDSIMLGGVYQNTSGDYMDSLITITGCDSIVNYNLTVLPFNTSTDVQLVCDSMTWIDGITYYADNNTATWVLTDVNGCDSTVTLDLTVLTATTSTDTQTACDSYTWIDGNTYTTSNNTATHVLSNAAGCDSTIILDLTILNSTSSTDVQTACDSYTWIDGNTYTSSNNTATWTVPNAVGCDSVITLDLTVSYTSSVTDVQTACDSMTWIDGNTYYASNNTATHVLTNAAGCDSTVTLDLTIVHATTGIDTQVACDSYTWIDGNTYTTSNNTATHVLTNAAGCDSTVTLNLTVNYSTSSTDVQTACDSYTWIDGNTYTASNNTATHTLTNAVGCDSLVTLDLTILNSTSSTDVQTACDTYTWIDGNTYTASNNTATWTIPNAVGCDSIITLDLTVSYTSAVTDVQTACDSMTWIDGITYYASNNTATHVLTNAAGCDSTVTLDLTIVHATTGVDTQVACDSYTWIDGNTYTASNNTATHVLTNAAGCDSTVTLNLTVNYSTSSTDVQTACDSFTWMDGNTYTASNNIATHTLTNAVGCDSVVTLDLTILNSTTSTDVQTACDSYTWIDGNTYTASNNTATWIVPNAVGCDSVITLNLTMSYTSAVTDIQTACDSLTWIDGITYYADNNTATHVLTNAAGCDSTVTLDLTIVHATTGVDTQVACDSITWIDGMTYYADNSTATHVLTNAAGCDSTVTLNLTVNYSTTSTDVHTACDSFTWMDGNTYTASNNSATHTLTNAVGCDSVITLDLTILNSTTSTDVQTACDTYTWIDGNTYTSSNNTATWTIPNAVGCDSVITLDLTMSYTSAVTDVQTACDSLTWIDGVTYYADNNTATHVLTNAAGCDSTVTLDLTIVNATTGVDTQVVCDSMTWIDGVTYYTDNTTATHVLTNAAGCDSTVTLNLTVNYSTTSTDTQSACDSYTWIDGNTYTASNNTATWTVLNAIGCDSIITLDLTILNSTTSTDVQTACDTYTWIDGNTYTTSNNSATWTIPNAAGCDSVITLDLTMSYSSTVTDVQTACDSLTWIDGVTYYANNNTATHVLTSSAGCDSTVTLDLTIVNATTSTDVQTACDSYTWMDGITYTASNNTATWTLTNAAGCDSIITLDLTLNYSSSSTDVITACDEYTWIDGVTYTSSNNTATHTVTNAAGCDSVITLDLTINTVDVNVTVNHTTLTADQSGATYQWLDCDNNYAVIPGETNQSYTPSVTGNYAVEVTINGCVDTSACFLVDYSGIDEEGKLTFALYPNPTEGTVHIEFAQVIAHVELEILNGLGEVIYRSTYDNSEMIETEIVGERGVYFIRILSDDHSSVVPIVKM